jgi:hypothetical protein
MEVLVIESSPGVAITLQHRLVRDGHEVITCNDAHGGPCRGVEHNDACPMAKHIDIAILARERGAEPSLNEMGSVCALRHRVPLVTLYPGDEFGPDVSTEVAAAVARRAVEAAYVAAIRQQLRHGIEDVSVQREYERVQVTLTVATTMSAQTICRLADRARQAVRQHDAHTPTIDISIVRAPTRID